MATLTARIDLPVGEHTVRDARSFAFLTAQAWEPDVSTEDLVLLVDELAAALVRRAEGENGLVLELSAAEHGLRVSLCDGAAARSAAAAVLRGATALVGLLVTAADRWGDEPYQDGYCLWFDLGPVRPATPLDTPTDPDDEDPDVAVEALLRSRRALPPEEDLPPR
ncbi:hypothetical protein [Actinomycetospora atypica]|uniref:Uncharacterized protein n=1 Tax=Actinomycetospora atypica TaxID=1290095 RepID=A0ABV9YJD1_9PSEU